MFKIIIKNIKLLNSDECPTELLNVLSKVCSSCEVEVKTNGRRLDIEAEGTRRGLDRN